MLYVALATIFVLAQIMVGYHHVGAEYAHAHSHDHAHPLAHTLAKAHKHVHDHAHDGEPSDFATACDICTIAATVSGSRDVSCVPDTFSPRSMELPANAEIFAAAAVSRPGGPRAPPQTL